LAVKSSSLVKFLHWLWLTPGVGIFAVSMTDYYRYRLEYLQRKNNTAHNEIGIVNLPFDEIECHELKDKVRKVLY
jgi:hypothetical protein